MIKALNYKEDIGIINVYISNNQAPKYMKQTWIKFQEEIDRFTIIVRYFNTLLSIIDKIRKKISNNTANLDEIIIQIDLIDF